MQGRTILVVDDSPTNRSLVAELLEMVGMTVFTAEDGRQGLEVFEAHRPSMVLSDVSMPEMHGLDLARAIRGLCTRTPIAFMTGGITCPDLSREVGDFVTRGHAKGILPKPFLSTELSTFVRRMASA